MVKEASDPCQAVNWGSAIGMHSLLPISSFAETSNSSMPLDRPHSQSLSSSRTSSSTSPMLLLLPPLSLHKPGWLAKRDDWGVRDNGVLAAVLGRACNEVLLLCRADERAGGKSRYGGVSGEVGDVGDVGEGLADGGDRRPGKEVKRGRIYESADGGGGGGGGGGFGGGNQS
jgi:hypothetical protein